MNDLFLTYGMSATGMDVLLCLPKMLSGANAFKISDLQEAENGSIARQAIRM
jgi:hypothetical protein